jgi:hypothetical protein
MSRNVNVAVLTKIGRAALVKSVKERVLMLAWGTGDPAWDDDEFLDFPALDDASALVAEVGRRIPTQVAFATPDDAGDIVIPKGITPGGEVQEARYAISEAPTPYLYVQTHYNFSDAADATIRELAVFMDSVPVSGLPPGQKYFLPSEIADPGMILAVQIFIPAINRSPSVRQTIDYVMPL